MNEESKANAASSVNPDRKTDRQKEAENELVFSYLTLRNLIGLSGMLLPAALALTTRKGLNDRIIEHSISDYYYSNNGDVLVVLLSMLGVFLFTYFGYKWREWALTTIAAICCIGVAFSPTATESANSLSIHVPKASVPMWLGVERHFLFAAGFFISIAVLSLVYFPRSGSKPLRTAGGDLTQKAKRNVVFRICGWTMVACVLLMGLYLWLAPAALADYPVIFLLETVAVEAFGLSWITKGQTLWPDKKHYLKKAFDRLRQ